MVKVHGRILNGSRAETGDNSEPDQLCELVVEDQGIGLDEKYLERIFEVFQRLHSRSAYDGTGIGLAICRKIAARHHGSITARSRPKEGAAFIVSLPVKQHRGEDG